MLAALKRRRNAACEPKKKAFFETISDASKKRTIERQSIHSSIKSLHKDARLLAQSLRSSKKAKIKTRKASLSQIEIEKMHFKKWIKHRNPRLNRDIDIKKKRRKLLRQWFGFLDEDHSGEISRDELGVPLISLGLASNMVEVDRLIASVDQDGSGDIDFFEFEEMLVNGAGGPIQQLLHAIQSGELGDPRVASVKSLMTTARRRKIVMTLHGYGRRSDAISNEDTKNRRTIKELQRMALEGGGADQAVNQLIEEGSRVVNVGILDENHIDLHEMELDKQMKDACLVLLENDKTKKRLPPLGNDRRRIKIKRSNRAELNKTMDCWKPYIQTLFAPLR